MLVAALAAVYFGVFVHYGILLEDEGLILLQIARTFGGERPYLDFHTGYTPGTFYLNAALFRLFGKSVIPIRAVLAAVNGATAGLLFALARERAGATLAAVVALGWAAYLPVFVGLFAAFNVPYPSWYGDCAFLATQLAFARHLATGRRLPLLLAGVAAGVALLFKQNAGALAALACGLTCALLRAGRGDPDRHLARVLLVLGGAFLLAGFTVAVTTVESFFILGPPLVLIVGRLLWARAPGPRTARLASSVALVAAGMLAVSVLWLGPFLAMLGLRGVLHEIFLIGTDFDLVYATPYPLPIGFPGSWPALATAGLAAAALAGVAVQRGRLRATPAVAALALGGAALCVLVVRWSRLPEGFARGTMLEVQHVGFFAAPLLGLVMAIAWLRRMREPGTAPGSFEPGLVGALVFALCSYAQLYPRIDPTHLIIALPSGLVLAAWAVARAVDAWSAVLRVPRRVLTAGVAWVGVGVMLVAVLPSFSAFFVRRDGALRARGRVAVDSPAAPVYLDDGHAADVRALDALLAYLRARLRPDEALFGFPAVPLVPYLLGHPSATRHDYWYAGRPDHLEEAEVVRNLALDPPRFLVSVNRNIGFFSNSARYYFILRAFVQEHYVLGARFGRYDVLHRREPDPEPLVVEDYTPPVDGDLRASLLDPLHEPRRAAALAFRARAGSMAGVAPLAARVARDEPTLLLLLRSFVEAPDLRVVPFLAETFATRSWRLRAQAGGVLNFIALTAAEHRYLLGRLPGAREPSPADLAGLVDPDTLRRWLGDRHDRARVGVFAAWVTAGAGDPAAVPALQAVLRTERKDPYLQMLSAYGLVLAGRPEYLCDLVSFLGDVKHELQDAVPSLLIEAAAAHPTELALCLSRGFADPRRRGREVSAWTAGAAGLVGAVPALRDTLDDPERRVRIAGAWALGRLGDERARPALGRLAGDDDAETRTFALDALARLDGRAP